MRRTRSGAPSGYGLYDYDGRAGNVRHSTRRRGVSCGCLLLTIVLVVCSVVVGAFVVAPVLFDDWDADRIIARLGPTTASLVRKVDKKRAAELEELAAQQDGLAYASLGEDLRKVYVQMLAGVLSREQSFDVEDAGIDDVEPAYRAVMVDHPELFWVDGSTQYVGLTDGPITITPGVTLPLDQVQATQEQIEAVADEFVSTLPPDADEYAIAKAAYEYLINNTDYDAEAEQNQNIQSVFLGHASVCAGYARAYQYLLRRAGVFCSYVEGSIPSREEDHAWNIVRIDGEYSYVDVTWGDPAYPGLGEEIVGSGLTYDYLCLTTEEILRDDHSFLDAHMWPACDSAAHDYYRLTGRMFETLDEAALSASFWEQCGEGSVSFKFTNDDAYVAARDSLAGGTLLPNDIQALFEQQGRAGSSYSYAYIDSLRIVRIYL